MPNGFSLLRTGQGNPSPVYNPELSRFNGWARQLPTLVRLPSRGRALDHPAHTPAQPLAGRAIPEFAFHQVPPAPHQVVIEAHTIGGATNYYNSSRLPTPCIISKLLWWHLLDATNPYVQIALSTNPVAAAGPFAQSTPLFQSQGLWVDPDEAIADQATITHAAPLTFDLNIPINSPPKNIISIRVNNHGAEPCVEFFAFHIQPL